MKRPILKAVIAWAVAVVSGMLAMVLSIWFPKIIGVQYTLGWISALAVFDAACLSERSKDEKSRQKKQEE